MARDPYDYTGESQSPEQKAADASSKRHGLSDDRFNAASEPEESGPVATSFAAVPRHKGDASALKVKGSAVA